MFEADGNADEAGRYACCRALVIREFCVGGAGGVGGDAAGVAEICGEGEHLQAIEEPAAGFEAAFELEAEDPAAIFHLLFGDGVLRVAWEEGVP